VAITWVAVLGLAAPVLIGLGVYAWRRRAALGTASFGLLMFAIAGWSLTYALEILGPDLAAKMWWIRLEYPFIVSTPALWLIFALQYTGQRRWLSRRNIILLSVIPCLTALTVWTNELHHLYYSATSIQDLGSWTLLQVEYGPWFWVHITFSYLCLLAGTLLLAGSVFRAIPLYRRQAGVLLLGALIPWLGNLLYLTRATPWPNLDLTPLAFALTGIIVAFGLFRYHLLHVVPVARQAVLDGMPAAMVVLDAEARIADLNPAARRLFELGDRDVVGQPARQVLWPEEMVARFTGVTQADTEIEYGQGDDRHMLQITISPLGDEEARTPPRLVLISDITEQTKAREALAQTNRRLLALQEGTAALTVLLQPATLFDRVMEQLERLLPYQRAILGLYDGATDTLTYVASRGLDPEELAQAERTSLQRHPGWVVRHRQPLLVADTETDPRVSYPGPPRNRSLILVPVLYQERCLGVLGLGSPEPSAYVPADQDLLLAFANQVAVALENARLYGETHRWASRLRVLYQVATAAATAASLDETLQRTVLAVQRTMGADDVALLLLEPETGELVTRAWVGFPNGPTLVRRQVGVGVPGWVVQTGQAVLIPDVRQDPRYHACDDSARSEVCVPLHRGQRVMGALNLESYKVAAFTDSDLRLLTTLAGHLAVIIENARLGQEARDKAEALAKRGRHLELLHEIAQVAASTLELPELYQALADTLAEIIGGDGCYITRFDEATGQVLPGGAYGPFRDNYRAMQPPAGEITLTESVCRADRPLAVEDVYHSPYISPRVAEMFPARSQLGLPLRAGERTLGAVLIAFNEPHTFTDEEITRATQAVDLAALALENARLYGEIRAWVTRLEQRVEARTRELRETQARLLHAEKLSALGQLSAGVAHEIGHPLGLIHGYIELLAEEQPDHPYIPPVRDSVERLMELLVQLRDFSRPTTGEWSPVAVNHVAGNVLALASKELLRSHVTIHQHMDADLPRVQADARQLEQVFLNLVLNARDAMPQGGKLQVRTFQTADHVVLEFADTGVGIPPENLERIFEPYFSTKHDRRTGLGLAISQRIIVAHAGRLEVISQPGEGATFRIYLPKQEPASDD
jgi:PAS domain S-box-containing protein